MTFKSEFISVFLRKQKTFWSLYKKNRVAIVGLTILSFVIFIAIIAERISPYPPLTTLVGDTMIPPNSKHIFGTDNLGRDVFSGVMYGARTSLMVGFLAAATSTILGILIGLSSGYLGGFIDDLLMRITELFMVIPRFFLALVLVAAYGTSIWNVIFVIGVLSWPRAARLLRAEVLSLKEREFVEAAKAIGENTWTILFKEILPNGLVPVVVNASIQVSGAILLEAGMSFMGVGDPNVPSWGQMLQNAMRFLRQSWWMATFPGLFIFITAMAMNLVGDGINDALNPRLKEK